MIKELFHTDGPVFAFLDKAGQLILLSLLWFLGCLPIVTLCTANAALYYAVIKSVRRGQGNAVKEFIHSYRANLARGIPITVTAGVLLALLSLNLGILQGQEGSVLSSAALIGIAVIIFCLVCIGPVLSRFSLKTGESVKLSFVMSLRFVPRTLVILVGAAAIALAQFYLLPVPALLILPGAGCWLATFPMEKSLRAYMPEKDESNNAWYYET